MSLPLLLLLNLVLSSMLTGLIWLVQVVHYPGLLLVGKESGISYQQHHTRSISWVVIPLMLAELFFAGWLLFIPGAFVPELCLFCLPGSSMAGNFCRSSAPAQQA